MAEDIRVTFYSITRCGYYGYGMKSPTFGSIEDTFTQLQKWTDGADLSITKLMDPAPDEDQLPVYLLDITKVGNDFVFACWNEVPSSQGAVTSISKDSKVGDPEVHQNALQPGSIPGYATYFWVVPERSVIASIKFMGATAGMKQMQDYVKRFLLFKSSYAIDGQNEEGEYTVVGYTDKEDGVPRSGIAPRFHVGTFRKKGRRAYLVENHDRISKVIRIGSVTVDKLVEKNMLQTFIHFVRGDVNRTGDVQGVRKARLELEYTPSEAELVAMMEADDADEEGAKWENLGFEIPGEPPIWINRSRASDSFSIEITPVGGVASVPALAQAVATQRGEMLKLLDDA